MAARAQLELGIDVQPARDVDRREQHVAELGGDARVGLGLRLRDRRRQLLAQLAQLVVEVRERAGEVRVLEADRLRTQLHLARVEQRRQPFRHVVEDPLAPLVLALDLPPTARARAPAVRASASPKTCGWRETSLAWIAARGRLEVACAALREQQREEVRLEEQVADLVEQLRVVAGERGVRDLVGLLDGVRHDRARGLLAVPGALAPEPLGQLLELDERVRERHRDEPR